VLVNGDGSSVVVVSPGVVGGGVVVVVLWPTGVVVPRRVVVVRPVGVVVVVRRAAVVVGRSVVVVGARTWNVADFRAYRGPSLPRFWQYAVTVCAPGVAPDGTVSCAVRESLVPPCDADRGVPPSQATYQATSHDE
jgi:hypothetical protein